ncbi:MAG TPA: D-arabinono-1,4-lactone oxidase [Solirubrobacteraceae bacterium]|jgi:FAD-linked oxidoreductase|nr:D-arabinono-1,4-lactone oxidase [Solirubrobacteraceae bacterium]
MREPSDPQNSNVEWRNWAGDQSCRPAAIAHPESIEEISAVVGRAAMEGRHVRVAGAGHSFSDIACTDGVLIVLDRFDRVLELDRGSSCVRVQGGITIAQLSAHLAEDGLALENLGDIDVQSVAGAISTATHGTGARLGNIPSQVVELTLVLADGSTLVCSQEHDPDLFRAARVGLGALGVVAEVTLRCVPEFTLRGTDAPAPLGETLERFEETALANEHFEFFVFPHCEVALTRTNNRTEEAPRPRGRVAEYANDVLLTNHAFELCCRIGQRLPSRIPEINRLVTRLAGSSKRVDRSDRIFASPRLVRFTEMEYALPREHTSGAVRRVLQMIERQGFAVPFPIEVRTVAPDDALLSTAAGRESGYVAVHMFRGMEWEPYFRAVERIMDELQGRPHWGKRHFQTAATLRPRYPEWDRFQAVRARLDPEGRFANAWTDRVLGPVGALGLG